MNDISKALFGRHLLLRRIGTGGMAEVFRALAFGTKGFRRLVAIKRILPAYSDDAQFESMFINEATIASHLSHSNIVQVHDFGRVGDRLYAAMDYVHGVSLMDLMATLSHRQAQPPIEAACYIVRKCLYGLEQAHEQHDAQGQPLNIIHRDISPANILLSFDGEVKIADFSIAKATASDVQTTDGVLKGKLRYMSPEQARSEPLDQRSDLFSLGACLYELLCLKRLYPAKGPLEVAMQVRDADFIPPREHNPLISQTLAAMLLKALQRNRNKRFSSASAWREAMESFTGQSRLVFHRSDLSSLLNRLFPRRQQRAAKEMQEEMDAVSHLDFAPMGEISLKLLNTPTVTLPLKESQVATAEQGEASKAGASPQMPVRKWSVRPPKKTPSLPSFDSLPSLQEMDEESTATELDHLAFENTPRVKRKEADTDPPLAQDDTVINAPVPKLPPRRSKKKKNQR